LARPRVPSLVALGVVAEVAEVAEAAEVAEVVAAALAEGEVLAWVAVMVAARAVVVLEL